MTVPVPERFRELAGQIGGFDPDALRNFAYVQSPFALRHWTVNVIEILLIAGAVFALVHAIAMWKRRRHPSFAIFWLATVVFVSSLKCRSIFLS